MFIVILKWKYFEFEAICCMEYLSTYHIDGVINNICQQLT